MTDSTNGEILKDLLHLPSGFLSLSDEELATLVSASWIAYHAEKQGVPLRPGLHLAQFVESLRRQTLYLETDDEALAGLEKIFRLMAGGDPHDFSRAGTMLRAHFNRRVEHQDALEEVATGRRRQSANASKPRLNGLQRLILEMLQKTPEATDTELLAHLRKREGEGIIDTINDEAIEWHEKDPRTGRTREETTPLSALKDRLSRARKKLGLR